MDIEKQFPEIQIVFPLVNYISGIISAVVGDSSID